VPIFRYVRKAFLYHWNLLFVGAGAALAFIAGIPDILLPLVGAAELVYLAAIASSRRFQAIMDAEDAPEPLPAGNDERVKKITRALCAEDLKRYYRLRNRCVELQRIAKGFDSETMGDLSSISDIRIDGINRLLWIFLKLLHAKNGLETFFSTFDPADVNAEIQRIQTRLADMGPETAEATLADAKRRQLLTDTLAASEQRLANHATAREKYDVVRLELDRLDAKIAGLAELGVNRKDPDHLGPEIDAVSGSVTQAETAMGELAFIADFAADDETAPHLLGEEPESNPPL